jgi:hypothetical protein
MRMGLGLVGTNTVNPITVFQAMMEDNSKAVALTRLALATA